MEKLISIVIPVYNVEKYIHKCLESILSQDRLADAEIILVDDGSKDASGSICDEYEKSRPDIIRVIHQPNGGASRARNVGLEQSSGKYIFFIDGDDTIEKHALAAIFTALEKHGYPDMLIFDGRIIDEDGNILSSRIPGSVNNYRLPANRAMRLIEEKEMLFDFVSAWKRVAKKEVYVKNEIKFPEGVSLGEDIGTTPKLLACSESIVYIDEALYNYLQREGSITRSDNTERRCNDTIKAFDIIINWFKENNLFNDYYSQLEYMAISELLVTQAIMIIVFGGSYEFVNKLINFTSKNFKKYAKNIYLKNMDKKSKLKIRLLSYKWFFVLRVIFKFTHLSRDK